MATLTLKGVPDDLLARLRAEATRERRSLNQHALYLLERACPAPPPPAVPLEEWRARYGPSPLLEADLEGLRDRAEVAPDVAFP